MNTSDVYVELKFRPDAALISVVRHFVSRFHDELFGDDDAASRAALATHELLENAVRHSLDGATTLRLEVFRHEGEQDELMITLENLADDANRAELTRLIDELNAAEDASEHYQRVMLESARRATGSGLGLARIHAEAEMALSCTIDGERVRVVAKMPVSAVGRARS